MTEEKMKELLKDLFEKHGIIDVETQDRIIDLLFESKVLLELTPEIKVNVQNLMVIKHGQRGCQIFDGRYYYILPYEGKAFDCLPDKVLSDEDFIKFENGEEM